MSINRTRWLDKLRPAVASSGGWTEGPMAPVETTDAATVDQRCSFKHRTGWRHNHSNSKLCVALRMGQANLLSITNCHLCAGARLSSSNNSIYSSHPCPHADEDVLVPWSTSYSGEQGFLKGEKFLGCQFFVVLQCEEPQKTDHRKQTGISPEWAHVSASGFPE